MEFLKKKHPLRLKYYLLVDVETHHGTSRSIVINLWIKPKF